MATADADIAELALSLSVEDTPVKLRCATCSHIAYNALRLPCCEQNICETCYNELEDMCQVCHHEPLNKSLCTPNKSLRTTTKVFLKKKLLERAKEQKKKEEDAPKSEATPVAAADSSAGDKSGTIQEGNMDVPTTTTGNQQQIDAVTAARGVEMSRKEASHKEDNEHKAVAEPSKYDSSANRHSGEGQSGPHDEPLVPQNESEDAQNDRNQDSSWQNGDMSNGGFNGMNGSFPMDFNQMMTGGMQMPGAGFPNMMGMGMDPNMMNQMSQSMFGGFGGPNMGMNGMGANMGTGFNGQNQFGGPWMGQGAFNGHGNNGGFGGQGGYNMSSQGNFNQMNQQYHNDYSNGYGRQGFHGRGGRGRRGGYYGGYGRNYHGYNQNGYANHASNHAYQQQSYQTGASATANAGADSVNVSTDNQTTEKEDEARMMKSFAPGGENDDAPVDREQVTTQNDSVKENHEESNEPVPDTSGDRSEGGNTKAKEAEPEQMESDHNRKVEDQVNEDKPLPIQSIVSDEPRAVRGMPPPGPHIPQGPSGRGFSRGKPYNSNGTANIPVVTEPIGVGVAGAPTGPKALREGLPNTSRSAFLARAQPPTPAPAPVPTPKKEEPMKSPSPPPRRSHSRSHSHPRSHPRSRSRSRSRTKSPERQYEDRHRSSRHRSRSRSANDKHESRDERSYRRSRRYEEDDRVEDDGSSRRSSHRSRRYHEREPEPSHRRHRERSYEREKDKDRYYEYEKERERDRERDYEDDRHRRRSKRSRSPVDSSLPTPTSAHPPDYAYEDEGSRKRRSREDDYDRSYDRHDRKRSKRDHSASPDRHAPHPPHSREASKPSTPATPSFPSSSRRQSDFGPGVPGAPSGPSKPIPTGPRASFAHGRRDRGRDRDRERDRDSSYRYSERPSHSSTNGHAEESSKAAEKDPHTLEREARDRERLMKEMQRRATMEGPKRKGSMSIRGSARRSGVKYEDEDEENAMRVEREREGARWR